MRDTGVDHARVARLAPLRPGRHLAGQRDSTADHSDLDMLGVQLSVTHQRGRDLPGRHFRRRHGEGGLQGDRALYADHAGDCDDVPADRVALVVPGTEPDNVTTRSRTVAFTSSGEGHLVLKDGRGPAAPRAQLLGAG